MISVLLALFIANAPILVGFEIDYVDCGTDDEADVTVGKVPIEKYPWLGVLYYASVSFARGDVRAVTTVALIHREFVVGAASDIGAMPKHDFRRSTRVLLGEGWHGEGRRVRNYVLHPEYENKQTLNSLALVQLKDIIRIKSIPPLCPPPELLRDPEFYVMRFNSDFQELQKEVVPMLNVPSGLCKDFYSVTKLDTGRERPAYVTCALEEGNMKICAWEAGAMLMARDHWGRWQLLGVGLYGPGCGAPGRYLDMMTYYPWIIASLAKFRRLTISKIHNHKYVLRSSSASGAYQRFGACDPEEKINLVYREMIVLRTDNDQYQFVTYNMTVYEDVEYSCLTLELVNASAVSEMKVRHTCIRETYTKPCYSYKGSIFEISVYMMFSDKCRFEMFAWGWKKNLSLIDIQDWKWEEGTYYEDFSMTRVEYRGPADQTEYGFEPLDESLWVPEYDYWTTTEEANATTTELEIISGTAAPKWKDEYDTYKLPFPNDIEESTEPESEFLIGIRW